MRQVICYLLVTLQVVSAQNILLSPELLAKQSDKEILSLLPKRARDKWVFRSYGYDKNSKWAKSWTRKVNLTGVAWDNVSNGVLISPLHILLAKHAGRNAQKPIYFHDTEGKVVQRKMVAYSWVGGKSPMPDLFMARLDKPVPSSVKFYRVLPPKIDWEDHLVGTHALITTDKGRKLTVAQTMMVRGGVIRFAGSKKVDKFYQSEVVMGDSANPSFLLINGEPILIEIHSTGGWGAGPFLSDPLVFAQINQSMKELGGGYLLQPCFK